MKLDYLGMQHQYKLMSDVLFSHDRLTEFLRDLLDDKKKTLQTSTPKFWFSSFVPEQFHFPYPQSQVIGLPVETLVLKVIETEEEVNQILLDEQLTKEELKFKLLSLAEETWKNFASSYKQEKETKNNAIVFFEKDTENVLLFVVLKGEYQLSVVDSIETTASISEKMRRYGCRNVVWHPSDSELSVGDRFRQGLNKRELVITIDDGVNMEAKIPLSDLADIVTEKELLLLSEQLS